MTNLHDNKKLDELLTALGLEPGLFWARAAILKWLHSADVEPSAGHTDAERYRWLRTQAGGAHMVVNGELLVGDELDRRIDEQLRLRTGEQR